MRKLMILFIAIFVLALSVSDREAQASDLFGSFARGFAEGAAERQEREEKIEAQRRRDDANFNLWRRKREKEIEFEIKREAEEEKRKEEARERVRMQSEALYEELIAAHDNEIFAIINNRGRYPDLSDSRIDFIIKLATEKRNVKK